jgi:hypothetical protein
MKHYTFTFKASFTEMDMVETFPNREGKATLRLTVYARSLEDAVQLLEEKLSIPFDTGDDE